MVYKWDQFFGFYGTANHSSGKASSVKLGLRTPAALQQFVSEPVDLEYRHLYLGFVEQRAVLGWVSL